MDENFLLKAAVVCSIIGIAVLYMISANIDVGETPINKINSGQADGEVLVKGKVSGITDRENVIIIDVERTESVPVFIFKDKGDQESIGINEGDNIEARGEVQDYEGKKEIIASEVRMT